MKKIPMVLLLVVPYVLLAVLFSYLHNSEESAVSIGAAVFGVAVLLNLVYPFCLMRSGFERQQFLFWAMVLKLCHIPFFVIVFFVGLLTNVMLIPLLPFVLLADYLLLLASSMYGICGLVLCYRRGDVTKPVLVGCMAAHLLFCIDVGDRKSVV